METTTVLISLIALITGVLLGYLLIKGKLNMKIGELQAKLSEKENQFNLIKIDFDNSNSELGSLKATNAGLSAKYEEALKAIEDQKTYITESTKSLKEAFGSLSSDALKSNNQSFLDLAKTTLEKHIGDSKADLEKRQQAINSLVKPIEDNLNKFDTNIKELEKNRVGAYTDIKNYLDGMKGTAENLQK
jgi:DNA recombination protein RmuC